MLSRKAFSMTKTITMVLIAAFISVLTACTTSYPSNPPDQTPEVSVPMVPSSPEVETTDTVPTPAMRWAAIPAVFVNDTYFRIFDDRQHIVPDLDDTWVYLGNIRSAAPGGGKPTQNFQTTNDRMIGAEIYHSSEGRIPITESVWGDPLDEEISGDCIIVVFEDQRIMYVSEEAHSKAYQVMDAVVRHSLMVDGVMYSFMGSGLDSDIVPNPNDNYVFLGEVESAVPIDEYPAGNLQANRELVVGMKAYRLPQNDANDIVVIVIADAYYYYKHLPGATP